MGLPHKSHRIILVGGLILAALTLASGISVYVVMQRQAESILVKSLENSLQSERRLFESEINAGVTNALTVSTRPFVVSKETGKPIRITEHHKGKTLAATGQEVDLKIKNPRPLRLPSGTTRFVFKSMKPSRVPARKIWPDRPGEAAGVVRPLLERWVQKQVDMAWQ